MTFVIYIHVYLNIGNANYETIDTYSVGSVSTVDIKRDIQGNSQIYEFFKSWKYNTENHEILNYNEKRSLHEVNTSICMYTYVCVYVCAYTYIYIYTIT
jgi:hypothetical protein